MLATPRMWYGPEATAFRTEHHKLAKAQGQVTTSAKLLQQLALREVFQPLPGQPVLLRLAARMMAAVRMGILDMKTAKYVAKGARRTAGEIECP